MIIEYNELQDRGFEIGGMKIMADNSKIKETPDEPRINIEEPWEINLWCELLQCTKDELFTAIKSVGNYEKDIRNYLNNKKE